MLSALWDKQPPAGQTFPISIHERWRPSASVRLYLFLYCYIFAPHSALSVFYKSPYMCALRLTWYTSHAWLCTAEDKLNKLWSKNVSEYFYYSVLKTYLCDPYWISSRVSILHFCFHFQDKHKCGNWNSCVCGTHHSSGVFHEATCSSSDVWVLQPCQM